MFVLTAKSVFISTIWRETETESWKSLITRRTGVTWEKKGNIWSNKTSNNKNLFFCLKRSHKLSMAVQKWMLTIIQLLVIHPGQKKSITLLPSCPYCYCSCYYYISHWSWRLNTITWMSMSPSYIILIITIHCIQ